MRPEHTVTITVEGVAIRPPLTYQVDIDLLQPADAFSFTVSFDARTYESCPLDGRVQIFIDDTVVLTGYIETVMDQGDGTLSIQGLDQVGRLVAESIPGAHTPVSGKRLGDVVAQLATPWFTRVEFSNAENRRLRMGRGKKPKTSREPALTLSDRLASIQTIEGGTTRWEAIERVTRPLQILPTGSADGTTLVLMRPQYDQEPIHEFFETLQAVRQRGAARRIVDGSNVLSMRLGKSNANRYAQIEVSGSGFPPGISPPPRVATFPGQKVPPYVSSNRIGVAFDGPDEDGTGGDFLRPKRLFVVSEALTTEEAQILANRIQAQGRARARTVEIVAPNHGQRLDGSPRYTLYTPDTVATIIKDVEAAPGDDGPREIVNAPFFCTKVTYQGSPTTEETALSFVPLNTLLI